MRGLNRKGLEILILIVVVAANTRRTDARESLVSTIGDYMAKLEDGVSGVCACTRRQVRIVWYIYMYI